MYVCSCSFFVARSVGRWLLVAGCTGLGTRLGFGALAFGIRWEYEAVRARHESRYMAVCTRV